MEEVKKMIRAIINGQSALKSELLKEINDVKRELTSRIDKLEENMNKRFDATGARTDRIGKQVAFLEDDAPTREEHDALERRVGKIEKRIASD
ncbi:MAG: hypothetical protein AAB599_03700 [Patescibacteria group bacterium]|mgnify:CR=1 FL=1